MHKVEDINELLEVLAGYGVDAWFKSSARQGGVLCVQMEYPLDKISDLEGLAIRLKNYKDIGYDGL